MNDKKEDRHRQTMFDKRSMLAAATTAFGNIKDWKMEDLKSASSLVTMMKPRDLKKLNTAVVSVPESILTLSFRHFLKSPKHLSSSKF